MPGSDFDLTTYFLLELELPGIGGNADDWPDD
jgi:hypothetical protein